MGCTSSLDQPAAASRAYREHDVPQPRQQPSCSGAASDASSDGGGRDAADVVQFVTLGNLPPVSHQAKGKHPSPGPRPCGGEGVKACASPVSAFSPTTAVPDKRSSVGGGVRIMKGFGSFGAGSPVAAARFGSIGGFTTSLNAATWGSAAALLSPEASVNHESRGPLWSTRTNGEHEEGDGDGAPSEEEAASERSALLSSSSSSSEGEAFSRVATLTACVCGTSAADSACGRRLSRAASCSYPSNAPTPHNSRPVSPRLGASSNTTAHVHSHHHHHQSQPLAEWQLARMRAEALAVGERAIADRRLSAWAESVRGSFDPTISPNGPAEPRTIPPSPTSAPPLLQSAPEAPLPHVVPQ